MRTISMFVLSSILFIFHILLAPAIEIFNAKIDFILISIILIAFFSKKWYPPVLCAVYSGLAVDITTQGGTYINTGIYLFFGIVLGLFVLFFKEQNFIFTNLTVFISGAIKHLIFVLLLYIMRFSESVTLATFFYGLPSAIYTLVASMGIYFIYKGIFSFSFMQEINDNEGNYII